MITRGLQCSVLLVIAVLSFSAQCQTAPQGHPGNPSAMRLARVVDEFWQHALKSRMYQGAVSNEAFTALPDYSEQKEKQEAAFAQHILEELQGMKTAELDHQDQITLRLLQWETRRISEEARFYWFYFQITPYTSPIPLAQRVFLEHPLRNQADLDDYLALLEKYPDFIGEISDSVHGQAERGIVLPQVEIPIALAFLSANLQEPEKNALFVSRERLSALDPAAATEFQKKVAAIITTRINPVFQRLVDYVGGDYAKKAPAGVGVSQYPGGREFYRYVVHVYTTLDITPEEVHRIGLEEVERTEAQMAEVRQAIGFKGSREEFHAFLKSDPRFFPRSPEEVEARLNSYLNRVLPLASKYFLHTPKAPYGIQRLAPALEGGQTFGHYEQPSAGQPKGIYYYNGSHLQERSLLPIGALLLHELIPGHHFQLNLQAENQSLPAFRRVPVHGAYIEGWANYSLWHAHDGHAPLRPPGGGYRNERSRLEPRKSHGLHAPPSARFRDADCHRISALFRRLPRPGAGVQNRQPQNIRAARESQTRAGRQIRHPRISRLVPGKRLHAPERSGGTHRLVHPASATKQQTKPIPLKHRGTGGSRGTTGSWGSWFPRRRYSCTPKILAGTREFTH